MPKNFNEVTMIFGNNLSNIRKSKEMSQGKLADLAGLSISTISRIESGRCETSLLVLFRLSKALRVSVDRLLQGLVKPKNEVSENFIEFSFPFTDKTKKSLLHGLNLALDEEK